MGLHQPKFHSEGMHMPYTNGGKTYDTGFHYLLEAHELGGKNKDGGFGGPLCTDPFVTRFKSLSRCCLRKQRVTQRCATTISRTHALASRRNRWRCARASTTATRL